MMGLTDHVGRMVARYVREHGGRAAEHIGDDVSRAIARHDWTHVHELERARLRLRRLERLQHRYVVV